MWVINSIADITIAMVLAMYVIPWIVRFLKWAWDDTTGMMRPDD